MTAAELASATSPLATEDYPIHSRVHELLIGKSQAVRCFVKREDELSCLISGSKIRKYRTLIATLKQQGHKKVALIGSQASNHVLGLSSLLIENRIEPTLFVTKTHTPELFGNALFSHLLIPKERIHLIDRKNWPDVMNIALKWQSENCNSCVIPEGGSFDSCIGGLATLAIDIIDNEEQLNLSFQHILIDAGTGITASGLIACFGFMHKATHLHVLLAAGSEQAFHMRVQEAQTALKNLTKKETAFLPPFTLYRPTCAQSFGSTNSTIFDAIARCARTEGVLLDPIYSAKLYLLLEKLLETGVLTGPVLFIHSGGLFSLSGFQAELTNVSKKP